MRALTSAPPVSHTTSSLRHSGGAPGRDLLTDFAELSGRLRIELDAVAEGHASGQADASVWSSRILDAYLLAAGMNQVLEDYLHLDALSLSKVAKYLAQVRPPVGSVAASSTRRVGATLHQVRGRLPGIRRLVAQQRALQSVVDQLADTVIRDMCLTTRPSQDLEGPDGERGQLHDTTVMEARRLLASLSRIPDALAKSVLRLPSCFRNFDQHPADCERVVRRFAERWPERSAPVVVVGIRTSGSYLAPLYAACLRAAGYQTISCMTLRPDRHWYRSETRQLRAWRQPRSRVLLADDPPSSGGAIAKAARQVESMGVPRSSITLAVPLFGPLESLPIALKAYDVIPLPWEEWTVHDRLAPAAIHKTLEHLLVGRTIHLSGSTQTVERATVAAIETCQRAPLTPTTTDLTALPPRRGHIRARYRVGCIGQETNERFTLDVYVKGVGLGYFGTYAEMAANCLHEFCPETFGTVDGLLYRAMLPEENRLALLNLAGAPNLLERVARRMASYVAQRQQMLGVEEDMSARLAGRDPVWQRGSRILGQPYGRVALFIRPTLLRIARQLLLTEVRCPAVIDGSMSPAQWFVPPADAADAAHGANAGEDGLDRLLKVDYDERAFSNQDLYCYDAFFDLASAAAHLDLESGGDSSLGALLRRHAATWIPDPISDERWLLYQLIALQSDAWYYSAVDASAVGILAEQRAHLQDTSAAIDISAHARWVIQHAYLAAERAQTRIFERYIGERYFADISVPTSDPICAIDIDGVLETGQLGFTAISPAGALALRALARHGYRPVLVTGRSLGEVQDRCAAYRLAGGAAEYGAVIYNHATGRVEVMLTAEQRADLEALRRVLERTDGVWVDFTYRYAVRAYRVDDHGGRRGLKPETIEAVLQQVSGRERLRPIIGYEQTDFMVRVVDKGTGIRALVEALDGSAGTRSSGPLLACAVGDTLSDLPMFDLAEYAFAPSNASGDVYARARTSDAHLRIMRRAYQAGLLEAVARLLRHHPQRCATCRPTVPTRDAALLLAALSGQDHGKTGKLKQAALLSMRAFMPAPSRKQ